MSFMISSAIVVPIAKTIASFLFGRIGDGFVDNTLIRRKTKIILAEDRKKINSLFKTEPEKEKWSKASFEAQYGKKVADCAGLIKAYLMSPCIDSNGYVTDFLKEGANTVAFHLHGCWWRGRVFLSTEEPRTYPGLLAGRDRLWGLFSGKNGQNIYEVYDRDLFNRACLIFFSVLLVDELAIIFLSHTFPVMALISFGVTVVAFIAFVIYLRKIARK